MGLTNHSVGAHTLSEILTGRSSPSDKIIALAGNPNVGKSSIFNALTGMDQHTGNWPGKTVSSACGICKRNDQSYIFVDTPGTYSLSARSAEEEVARDFICFGDSDATVVICDATCLERNINLALQIMQARHPVIICVNLMDQAKRRGIIIDTALLSERLGIPVIPTSARDRKSLDGIISAIDSIVSDDNAKISAPIEYPPYIQSAIERITAALPLGAYQKLDGTFTALRLLEGDESFITQISSLYGVDLQSVSELKSILSEEKKRLEGEYGSISDIIAQSTVLSAERLCEGVTSYKEGASHDRDRRIDRILTGKLTAYPIMAALLMLILWLTISGANYISEALSYLLFGFQHYLEISLERTSLPPIICDFIINGIYRVPAWVVSVMLPPMAIFFPLFTLLEDVGYLPRIAYNLDLPFQKCKACGKQALTMCMGFGCNAAGVVGCRIIDSKRERLLAILTNSFIPCNGKFPALISVITMFLVWRTSGIPSSITASVILTLIIILGIAISFAVTGLLSSTVLKGIPSSFMIEMPPYRMPDVVNVLIRSVFDRTVFVLGRAITASVPAGIIIWFLTAVKIGDASLLHTVSSFLDPIASHLGLDGVILTAFILGLPANEIVIPIIIMAYTSGSSLTQLAGFDEMKAILISNGWSIKTAVCVLIFFMLHWPCATTLMTIKKETGSLKWTALAAIIPTAIGILLCLCFNFIYNLAI